MPDKIVRMPASTERILDAQTAQTCTELLAQAIWQLDTEIERAEELLGTDQVHLFLRAIKAHIETELDTRLKLPRIQS
jgi:hypothetical protein